MRALLPVIAVIAGAALLMREAGAVTGDAAQTGFEWDFEPLPDDSWTAGDEWGWSIDYGMPGVDVWDYEAGNMTVIDDRERAINALIYAIRRSEHSASDVASGLDFRTFFGGSRFNDLSDHPVLTGEKRGVPIDFLGPRYKGLVSTAAGAGQIILPTWREIREIAPRLPDFSPESQLQAMRRLLQRAGAIEPLLRGDVETAIRRASTQWASLPGSSAGQGGRTMAFVLDAYQEGLA